MKHSVASIACVAVLWPALSGMSVLGDEPTELDPGTAALIDLLPQLDDPAAQLDILKGVRAGLQGQRQIAPPPSWQAVYRDHLSQSKNAEVRELADLLALQFGDAEVRRELLRAVADEQAPLERRREALATLAEIRASELPGVLHGLLAGSALRPQALRVLAEFGTDETPTRIIEAYPNFHLEEKRIAIDALSSSVDAAKALLRAVEARKIPRTDLNAQTIRRLKLLDDESIDQAIAAHWGITRETPQAKAERIAAYKQMLTGESDHQTDLPHGRAIFAKTCRQCHTLYGDGEKVGPDITGSNRSDLDYLLLNVVDPNATIGKDYQAWSVATDAGKLHVGLVAGEDDQVLTLRTETDTINIPKDEIEFRELTPVSMMPEGLFDPLSTPDLRDLVAYLRGNRQVPLLATAETAGQFFNGRDLTHWTARGGDWRVIGGEIHGSPKAAITRQASLISDMLLDECVIEMEVKLVAKRGAATIALVPQGGDMDASGSAAPATLPVRIALGSHGNLHFSHALSEAECLPLPQVTSPWHSVQIARAADEFQVTLDGRKVLAAPGDALPRFRLAFILQEGLLGDLMVRTLRLNVPNGTAAAADE